MTAALVRIHVVFFIIRGVGRIETKGQRYGRSREFNEAAVTPLPTDHVLSE
jgi:hypothetical protein